MTLTDFQSRLITAAATAGAATFFIGFLEDMASFRESNTEHYPVIRLLPPDFPVGWEDLEEYTAVLNVSVHYRWNRNESLQTDPKQIILERTTAWTAALAMAKLFINALDDDTGMSVIKSNIPAKLYAEGQNLENTVTVNFNPEIKLFC